METWKENLTLGLKGLSECTFATFLSHRTFMLFFLLLLTERQLDPFLSLFWYSKPECFPGDFRHLHFKAKHQSFKKGFKILHSDPHTTPLKTSQIYAEKRKTVFTFKMSGMTFHRAQQYSNVRDSITVLIVMMYTIFLVVMIFRNVKSCKKHTSKFVFFYLECF